MGAAKFNWRCALNLHPWGKWSEPRRQAMLEYGHTTGGVYVLHKEPLKSVADLQTRSCAECGKIQEREL